MTVGTAAPTTATRIVGRGIRQRCLLHGMVVSEANGNLRLTVDGGASAPNANTSAEDVRGEHGGIVEDTEVGARNVGAERRTTYTGSCRGGTRSRLTIASLNVNGYAASGNEQGSKWLLINQLMREEKLSILAVQETHLNAERSKTLRDLFGEYLSLHSFVINKRRMTDTEALLLKIPWTSGRKLTILNNAEFWQTVKERLQGGVDIILGDFNIVEDEVDLRPVEELRKLCRDMRVTDGWRSVNLNQRAFTLDRIYATRQIRRDASVWKITESGVPTDHKMIAVSIANRAEPYRGRGRWSLPLFLLEDPEMVAQMKELAAVMARTAERNPQTVYREFKRKLRIAAREKAKEKVPKIQRRLDGLRRDLTQTLNSEASGGMQSREVIQHVAILQERITTLERKKFGIRRTSVEETHWEADEVISKQRRGGGDQIGSHREGTGNGWPPDGGVEGVREVV
ncbi:hypothetical protein C2E23DRAFT_871359 [Lenzites betulinus]|nr:hypothetical protein C2E23DRAFT_871359 [Lenzites betulinus]